jgi:hypothetical protein
MGRRSGAKSAQVVVLVVAGVVAHSACSADRSSPDAASATISGLFRGVGGAARGTMSGPLNGTITVRSGSSITGHVLETVKTTVNGSFVAHVPSGTFVLTSTRGNSRMVCVSEPVTVTAETAAQADVICDFD